MKKILTIISLSLILFSCQKENIETPIFNQETIYIQVEAIQENGTSIYTNISLVK